MPPLTETADMAWDDDTAPRYELDEPSFERITAVPELPPEVYARRMMGTLEASTSAPAGALESRGFESSVDPAPEQDTSPGSCAPFELEAALFSSEPPAAGFPSVAPPTRPHRPDAAELARAARNASTRPPFATRSAAKPPAEESTVPGYAVDPAAGAAMPARFGLREEPRRPERPASLELDLSGLDGGASLPPSTDPIVRELKDRYAMGDYSGALVVAEGVLDGNPGHIEALRFAKNCRDVLTQMYAARLGALDQIVLVGIPADQIRWLSLDHRAGFLLSLVDGSLSIEEILDISGMPRLDALRIMFSLLEERVITLRARQR